MEKFPDHPNWKGHKGEEGCWWTVMRAGLLKTATHNQDTDEDESTTTHLLYMENKPGYQPRVSNEVINSEVDSIDMNFIMKNMIQHDSTTPGISNGNASSDMAGSCL